jgi:hypothetical protein
MRRIIRYRNEESELVRQSNDVVVNFSVGTRLHREDTVELAPVGGVKKDLVDGKRSIDGDDAFASRISAAQSGGATDDVAGSLVSTDGNGAPSVDDDGRPYLEL